MTSSSRICVAVRKRPTPENTKGDIVETPSPYCIVNEPKVKYDLTPYTDRHTFTYDVVFSEYSTNAHVYESCCLPLVETVFSNGNATCFAYGQTGSGKTYTMLGSPKEPGIYAYAAQEIFARAGNLNAEVYVAFYEIYGRKIFDLLNNHERLFAREDADKVINICGLSEHKVDNFQAVLDVITEGSAYRAAGQTSANNESSRSHAVLQMEVRHGENARNNVNNNNNNRMSPGVGIRRNAKLIGRISFIDLAGNERGADTFDCDRRTRMEGAEINQSLLALKECIRALGMGNSHVPFRGSILTEVLRDSFTGNSRTAMIATISPAPIHCFNTLNTLRYTQRVKDLNEPLSKGEQVISSMERATHQHHHVNSKEQQSNQQQRRRPQMMGRRRQESNTPIWKNRPEWVSDFSDVSPSEESTQDEIRSNHTNNNNNNATSLRGSNPASGNISPTRTTSSQNITNNSNPLRPLPSSQSQLPTPTSTLLSPVRTTTTTGTDRTLKPQTGGQARLPSPQRQHQNQNQNQNKQQQQQQQQHRTSSSTVSNSKQKESSPSNTQAKNVIYTKSNKAIEVKVKDPKIATIVKTHLAALQEDDSDEDILLNDDSDSDDDDDEEDNMDEIDLREETKSDDVDVTGSKEKKSSELLNKENNRIKRHGSSSSNNNNNKNDNIATTGESGANKGKMTRDSKVAGTNTSNKNGSSSSSASQQLTSSSLGRLDNSNGVLEKEEARQVRKVHAYVVDEIAKAEEKLIALHRRHISNKMIGMKEELHAIQTFEKTDAVDEYVSYVRELLMKQRNDIDVILEMLNKIGNMLKDEEDLSNTLSSSVRHSQGRKSK